MKQGYLYLDHQRTIRVRVMDGKGYLIIKSKNKGATRLEFKYEIP